MKFFVSFFIFSFLISISVQAHAVCPNYKIVSALENQKQDWVDWCTFAASRVVTSHYGLTKSQCQLVEDVVNHQPCCTGTNFFQVCHPSKWPADVFNSSTVNFSYKPHIVGPALDWGIIVKEICDHNRPLLAVVTTTKLYEEEEPNWHAVVVEGYSDINGWPKVNVFDPIEDLCVGNGPTCKENPTFYSYDSYFLSDYTHHTDYYEIAPKPKDTAPPSSPHGLSVR